MDCKCCNGISKIAQREPYDFYATPPPCARRITETLVFPL